MTDVLKIFEDNISKHNDIYRRAQKNFAFLSYGRVALVLVFLGLFVWFANQRMAWEMGLVFVLFPLAFGLLVARHNRSRYRRDQARFMVEINRDEIERNHHRTDHVSPGEEFIGAEHAYSADLDVFGRHSLFTLLNRTATASGRECLARTLSTLPKRKTVLTRQEAVKELKSMTEWRQEFQATGMHFPDQASKIKVLRDWLGAPPFVVSTPMKIASFVLPVLTVGSAFGWLWGPLPLGLAGMFLVINMALLARTFKAVQDTTEKTWEGTKALKSSYRLIEIVEKTNFQSEGLRAISEGFGNGAVTASGAMKKLYLLLDYLNSRSNMFYHTFNMFFFIDLHLMRGLEKWKNKYAKNVSEWFSLLGEMEAYNSLAGYAFNQQGAVFPEITEEEYVFQGKDIGHPLIALQSRVNNDFDMTGRGTVAIITGSNMSGKSTFQRTLGINAVLAYSGAPVSAREMRLSVMQPFTSMRVSDKLDENVSSFYAELKRIRAVLDLVKNPDVPVFYLLDEILKGTNSHDRHAGAMALVRQLVGLNGMGLVSTHDLELGALSKELPTVSNYSFNSSMEGDRLVFDYKLTEGICKSFNASQLMKQMGIEMG